MAFSSKVAARARVTATAVHRVDGTVAGSCRRDPVLENGRIRRWRVLVAPAPGRAHAIERRQGVVPGIINARLGETTAILNCDSTPCTE